MMEWFNILMARLRAIFRRESVLQDIEEELRVHVEMETETNIKRGMPPDEARAAALISVVNAVVFLRLPFSEADRLVLVAETDARGRAGGASPANFLDWREQSRAYV